MISCCILLSFFTVHNIVCSMFWGFPAHILAVVGGMLVGGECLDFHFKFGCPSIPGAV